MTRTYIQVPQQPWFVQFFELWQRTPECVFIRELETGKEATFAEFLYEVFVHRDRLKSQLSPETLRRLQDPSEEVFIATVASAGFDFVVLLFAIYRSQVHLEEAHYFLGTCNAVLITNSQHASSHAETIAFSSSSQRTRPQLISHPTTPPEDSPSSSPPATTGPSKGALSGRGAILKRMESYKDGLSLSTEGKWLHHASAHRKGGFDFLLAAAYTGASIEFCSSVFSPAWFWARIQHNPERDEITCLQASPTLLTSLREIIEQIRQPHLREQSLQGLNAIRLILAGSMRVPDSTKDMWRELWPGQELVNLYLSADPNVMDKVFDSEGFYKTGDLGKVSPDGEIWIFGLANHDSTYPYPTSILTYQTGTPSNKNKVIRTMCHKINSADLEDPLHSHPGVSQAFVLGVEDPAVGQRVAALLLAKPSAEVESELAKARLADLRWWLAVEKQVPGFKLPALLMVIRQAEFAAKTDSGRPSKRKIAGMYFGDGAVDDEVQVWDFSTVEGFPGDRPWDWEGRAPK
ncbi:hypothetical protein BDW62DRAFT_206053 [Aspergillus aurantiobrunneus]